MYDFQLLTISDTLCRSSECHVLSFCQVAQQERSLPTSCSLAPLTLPYLRGEQSVKQAAQR